MFDLTKYSNVSYHSLELVVTVNPEIQCHALGFH